MFLNGGQVNYTEKTEYFKNIGNETLDKILLQIEN
jgi:hypothetical protein